VADDGRAPSALFMVGVRDLGAKDADFALVGIERFNVVNVPEFDVLLFLLVLHHEARGLIPPERQGLLQWLVVVMAQDNKGTILVFGQLGQDRSIGIEAVEDHGVDEGAVDGVQAVDEPQGGGQFALVGRDVFFTDQEAGLFVAYRLKGEHNIQRWADEYGHHVTVVVLSYFFLSTVTLLDRHLSIQAIGTMSMEGIERFPSVDSRATQGAEFFLPEGFVSFGFAEYMSDGLTNGPQVQFIQDIADRVGTESFDVLSWCSTDQLLEVGLFQISLQCIDARNAKQGRVD